MVSPKSHRPGHPGVLLRIPACPPPGRWRMEGATRGYCRGFGGTSVVRALSVKSRGTHFVAGSRNNEQSGKGRMNKFYDVAASPERSHHFPDRHRQAQKGQEEETSHGIHLGKSQRGVPGPYAPASPPSERSQHRASPRRLTVALGGVPTHPHTGVPTHPPQPFPQDPAHFLCGSVIAGQPLSP